LENGFLIWPKSGLFGGPKTWGRRGNTKIFRKKITRRFLCPGNEHSKGDGEATILMNLSEHQNFSRTNIDVRPLTSFFLELFILSDTFKCLLYRIFMIYFMCFWMCSRVSFSEKYEKIYVFLCSNVFPISCVCVRETHAEIGKHNIPAYIAPIRNTLKIDDIFAWGTG